MNRYIQIYTGDGKGKTTAAIGQAIRAAGEGFKTLIIMFMKDYPYNEIKALKRFDELITVEQYGNDEFVLNNRPPSKEEKKTVQKGLKRAYVAIVKREYDIVVLDEACVSAYFGLFSAEDVIPLLTEKPDDVEVILTGRYCPESWIEKADLVTEMKEIKHYYKKGILARRGFES